MTTSVGAPVTWITMTVRCKWCNKPHATVRAIAGATVTFKCADRGCRMEQEARIT